MGFVDEGGDAAAAREWGSVFALVAAPMGRCAGSGHTVAERSYRQTPPHTHCATSARLSTSAVAAASPAAGVAARRHDPRVATAPMPARALVETAAKK